MTTKNLIFWAQALDNTSPDHFSLDGEEVSPSDLLRRKKIVSLFSGITKSGKRIFNSQNEVILTASKQHFVIEVPSVQRDSAGRIAPIVCYGSLEVNNSEELGKSVAEGLENFAKSIERTLHQEHLQLARDSFQKVSKKPSAGSVDRSIKIGTVAILIVIIIYWLLKRS